MGAPTEGTSFAEGVRLLRRQQPKEALRHLLVAAELTPDDARVWLAAGIALRGCGDPPSAEAALRRTVKLDPRSAAGWTELGALLALRGVRDEPIACWRRAITLAPDHVDARVRLAAALLSRGALDEACEHLSRALALAPTDPGVRATAVALLERRGHLDDAWALVTSSPTVDPRLAVAAASVGRRTGNTVAALRLVDDTLGRSAPSERSRLLHARAELLDTLDRVPEAFAAWDEANRARGLSFDPVRHQRAVDRIVTATTGRRWPEGIASERPVLIVGVPRTGSTVLEQALSRHSQIVARGELEALRDVALAVPGSGETDWVDALDRLAADDSLRTRLGSHYLGALGADGARVTDKMPNNLLHLGLLAMLVPGARVIRCRRDPVDTAWSCFRQVFGAGLPWATDLGWITTWIREAERLLDHQEAVLPLRFCSVAYEDLTTDPEPVLRRVCAFLDLPFDPAVLSPEQASRRVATASALEVEDGLHTRSIGRARRYEPLLPAATLALRDHSR